MNAYEVMLAIAMVASLALLVWRGLLLARQGPKAKRRYACFWLWPVALQLLAETVPLWQVRPILFNAAFLALAAGLACDFFFYYGLRHESQPRRQAASLLLALPLLALIFRYSLLPGPARDLVLPCYGRALVWTDGVLTPSTYWFMAPGTRGGQSYAHNYDDPNYGKAVFAPLSGTVAAIDGAYLVLQGADGRIRIGPFAAGTIRVAPGDPVVENQPLGLLGTGGSLPGIELKLLDGPSARFKDHFAGIWYATRRERGALRRNQSVLNDAPTRFRLD